MRALKIWNSFRSMILSIGTAVLMFSSVASADPVTITVTYLCGAGGSYTAFYTATTVGGTVLASGSASTVAAALGLDIAAFNVAVTGASGTCLTLNAASVATANAVQATCTLPSSATAAASTAGGVGAGTVVLAGGVIVIAAGAIAVTSCPALQNAIAHVFVPPADNTPLGTTTQSCCCRNPGDPNYPYTWLSLSSCNSIKGASPFSCNNPPFPNSLDPKDSVADWKLANLACAKADVKPNVSYCSCLNNDSQAVTIPGNTCMEDSDCKTTCATIGCGPQSAVCRSSAVISPGAKCD